MYIRLQTASTDLIRFGYLRRRQETPEDTVLPNKGKVTQHWQNTIHLCPDSRWYRREDLPQIAELTGGGSRFFLHEFNTYVATAKEQRFFITL
jgi:hypothetical protein